MLDVDDELISFDSDSPRASMRMVKETMTPKEEEGKTDRELLEFYRERCRTFQEERQTMLDRLTHLEISKEEFHRLKWSVKMKNEEITELEESLKKANAALFQKKQEMIELEAINKNLQIQNDEDRKKIQHLLALTQPVTEEVTFFRDRRPEKTTKYPLLRNTAMIQPPKSSYVYPYPSTMSLTSEKMATYEKVLQHDPEVVSPPSSGSSSSSTEDHQFVPSSNGTRLTQPRSNPLRSEGKRIFSNTRMTRSSRKNNNHPQEDDQIPISGHFTIPQELKKKRYARAVAAQQSISQVLRTIYMPNEQTIALEKTIENLQEQLEKQKQLSEEKIQNLIESFASEKARSIQSTSHLMEKSELMEKNLEKAQRILHQTTKDYLILRHHSQEAERSTQEEVQLLREQCDQLLKEKKVYSKQALAETEALREAVREESEQHAEEYRNQALAREREVLMLKEQYAAIQETYNQRIKDLQTRLTKLRIRYKALEKRRNMEMEGFTRDIFQLKKTLQKLETYQYSTKLSTQERKKLFALTLTNKNDEQKFLLETDALTDEIHSLQNRFTTLASDIKRTLRTQQDGQEEEEGDDLSEESENNHALYNKHKYTSVNSIRKKKPLLIDV